jgi:hypothetical protein
MRSDFHLVIIFSLALLSLLSGSWIASAQTPETLASISEAYERAYEEDGAVRNFVYLFLRVAGAVWIGVEWVAAVALVVGYRALRTAFLDAGEGS